MVILTLLKTTMVGAAVVTMFDAKTIVDLYEAMLRKNPYRLFGIDE